MMPRSDWSLTRTTASRSQKNEEPLMPTCAQLVPVTTSLRSQQRTEPAQRDREMKTGNAGEECVRQCERDRLVLSWEWRGRCQRSD